LVDRDEENCDPEASGQAGSVAIVVPRGFSHVKLDFRDFDGRNNTRVLNRHDDGRDDGTEDEDDLTRTNNPRRYAVGVGDVVEYCIGVGMVAHSVKYNVTARMTPAIVDKKKTPSKR